MYCTISGVLLLKRIKGKKRVNIVANIHMAMVMLMI